MRCPDCNKFTGLESADPEVNDLSVEYLDGSFHVTASVHHARNCADCGTELKAVDLDLEADVDLESLEGFDKLTEEQQSALRASAGDSAEVKETGSSADESGGGRYAKNIITVNVEFALTVSLGEGDSAIKLQYSGTLSEGTPASCYDEQV